MIKIAFILNNINQMGGVEKITTLLANELINDYEVYIINLNNIDKTAQYALNTNIKNFNLNHGSKLSQLFQVKRIIKKNKIDYIIIQTKNNYYFAYLKLLTNKKVLFVDHDSLRAYPYKQKNEYLPRKRVIKFVDTIVLLTEDNKKEYIKQFKINSSKIKVIPNFIEETDKEIEYDGNSKTIVAIGRYHIQKRFDLLIEAFSLIANKYNDWTIKIYGDGELKKQLQQLIDNNKLSNRIFLCGKYESKDEAYGNKSFLVMSSEHEGFPMTLLEAFSYKLPIISYNLPSGPSEIIENNINGLLVEHSNINKLADAMECLICSPSKRRKMSKNTTLSLQKFTKNIVIPEWKKILK